MFEIPGVLTMGQSYRLDAARTEDHYEVVEGLNLSLGKHQLSVAEMRIGWAGRALSKSLSGIFLFPTLEISWQRLRMSSSKRSEIRKLI